MKLIFAFLITLSIQQENNIKKADQAVDKFAADFNKTVNDTLKEDYLEKKEAFDRQMDAIEAVLAEKVGDVRVMRVDNLKILTTDNCDALPVPPQPPKVPEEIDCITA